MKAESGKRYHKDGRTDLTTVIPLDTPLILYVDPSSVCNFKCTFCPCSTINKHNWSDTKKRSVMKFELFKKIIDDASQFPKKIKTLRLYKEGEPLLNKRLPDMIKYAHDKGIFEKIDFTTNGAMLTPDLSLRLIDAGINRINISITSLSAKEYKDLSGVDIHMGKFLNNLEFLYENKKQCHILIKISDVGLGGHSEQKFYDMFGDLCDEITVEHIVPVWPEFNLDSSSDEYMAGLHCNEIRECLVCPYIFYSICVNSTGSVSSCLMDWNHLLIVGNVRNNSIVDIWNNEKMFAMRLKNLEGKRAELDTCSNCGQMKYATIDNIDNSREKILNRFLKEQ